MLLEPEYPWDAVFPHVCVASSDPFILSWVHTLQHRIEPRPSVRLRYLSPVLDEHASFSWIDNLAIRGSDCRIDVLESVVSFSHRSPLAKYARPDTHAVFARPTTRVLLLNATCDVVLVRSQTATDEWQARYAKCMGAPDGTPADTTARDEFSRTVALPRYVRQATVHWVDTHPTAEDFWQAMKFE